MSGRRHTLVIAATLAALALSGCSKKLVEPNQSHAVMTPGLASTPAGVIELLRLAWVERSPAVDATLFTDDFVFAFSATDSAGNAYRERPWIREDELISAENLFVTGKGGEEAATSIMLEFGNSLVAVADPRAGREPRWHRYLNVDVVMVIKRPSGDFEIKGAAKFYVVRGDSAHIPADLGVGPDSTRWYIERWEDDTAGTAGAQPGVLAPQPAGRDTWGKVKSLYR